MHNIKVWWKQTNINVWEKKIVAHALLCLSAYFCGNFFTLCTLLEALSPFFPILFSNCHSTIFFYLHLAFISSFCQSVFPCLLIPLLCFCFFFPLEKSETWSCNTHYKLVNYSPLSPLKNVVVSSNKRRGTFLRNAMYNDRRWRSQILGKSSP